LIAILADVMFSLFIILWCNYLHSSESSI